MAGNPFARFSASPCHTLCGPAMNGRGLLSPGAVRRTNTEKGNMDLLLPQVILGNIHGHLSVGKEGDPLCRQICIHGYGQHLLPVVDENLGTERVQDDPQLQFSSLTPHQAAALMNDGSPGTGKFTVDLQHRLMGTEA